MYSETHVCVKINQNFSLNFGASNYLFQISKADRTKILLGKWNMIIKFPKDKEFSARVTRCKFIVIIWVYLWGDNFRPMWTAYTISPSTKIPLKLNFEDYVAVITLLRQIWTSLNMIILSLPAKSIDSSSISLPLALRNDSNSI